MVTFFNRKKKKLNVRQNRNWQDKERRLGINKNATTMSVMITAEKLKIRKRKFRVRNAVR